jgi:hypothetical protein
VTLLLGFTQVRNPVGGVPASTLLALAPVFTLLVLLAVFRVTAWLAVIGGSVVTILLAIFAGARRPETPSRRTGSAPRPASGRSTGSSSGASLSTTRSSSPARSTGSSSG